MDCIMHCLLGDNTIYLELGTIWRRDNSSPRGRICSTEGRPIQERRQIPIARSKEVAMRWKCHGNVSAEMCFNLGERSRRGGPNESMFLYATPPHSQSVLS